MGAREGGPNGQPRTKLGRNVSADVLRAAAAALRADHPPCKCGWMGCPTIFFEAVAVLLEDEAAADDVAKSHGARGLDPNSDTVHIATAYLSSDLRNHEPLTDADEAELAAEYDRATGHDRPLAERAAEARRLAEGAPTITWQVSDVRPHVEEMKQMSREAAQRYMADHRPRGVLPEEEAPTVVWTTPGALPAAVIRCREVHRHDETRIAPCDDCMAYYGLDA